MLLCKNILFCLLLITQGVMVNISDAFGENDTLASKTMMHCSKDSSKGKTHSCCKKQKEKPSCCDHHGSAYSCCCFTTFFVDLNINSDTIEPQHLDNFKKALVFSKIQLYSYQYLFEIEEPPEGVFNLS